MSERLRDDIEGLGVLCSQAAEWHRERGRSVSSAIIEKDFWVTEALRVLSRGTHQPAPGPKTQAVNVRSVFKGGTSLSKAYRLIDRFSEDIDVFLVITPDDAAPTGRVGAFKLGGGRIDTLMKQTAADVAAELGVPHESWGTTRAGTKRGFCFAYPRPEGADEATAVGLKEGVLLELVRMGTPTPNAPHELRSMLSHWAAMTASLPLGDFDELQPFVIDVLAPERTLVDKLCILHDVGTQMQADDTQGLHHHSRHYYDVHQLLSAPAVQQSLAAQPHLVAHYAETAAQESVAVRRPGVQRPEGGFGASPAFSDEIVERAAEQYDAEMTRLSFSGYPPLKDVAALARRHAPLL